MEETLDLEGQGPTPNAPDPSGIFQEILERQERDRESRIALSRDPEITVDLDPIVLDLLDEVDETEICRLTDLVWLV